ncbi:MAG: BREX-3 system P-loop-containing protein BrxF [Eubacterium sp.]|nr:BREX-3 system P-loop-containing protein BrxF [Eubacterium sp.]
MGVIIKARDLPALERSGIARPVLYCHSDKSLEEQAVPINVEMAKKLSAIKPNRRTMRMEQCFQQVLGTLPDYVIIKDFDVMFNPDYEVDVLRIMCSAARTKSFRVLWPGKCEDGRLIYAEEGFRDYKVFEISKYDVTIVV